MADLGNPNVFTLFKGRYDLTPVASLGTWDKTTVMLTSTNEVQILGDLTLDQAYTEGTVVAVLPEEVRPSKTVAFPVIYQTGQTNYGLMELGIRPNGEMVLGRRAAAGTVIRVNGCQFNISDRWY